MKFCAECGAPVVLRTPQEIANPAALDKLALTEPTDTAADWPAGNR